ncbi:MAG: hypothetical protein AMS27_00915 [Bacteroides sp. SM23_62_1]|nr:MAG: hypothetical protein AMS27_00915 [Bacteroides sp. SM23_62_1]
MTVLYYDCFSGISGDMNLGALIDLGVDPDHLKSELRKLNLEGFKLEWVTDSRKGISGTRAIVKISEGPGKTEKSGKHGQSGPHHGSENHDHSDHRNLDDIRRIIENSRLNEFIKKKSLEIFQKVAEAEAKVHGKSVDDIHFHEVGAIDSIVDIVGAAICIDYLKPDRIISSSVELGGGFVKCAHGILPVPAPATVEILKDIPVKYGAVQSETTTPTGAAILAVFTDQFSDKPHFRIQKTGYGIGERDHDIPNVLRVHLGMLESHSGSGIEMHTASLIECNIDDMNPEIFGFIMDQLFEKGADDVFITPIIMKKARPASKLSVLCSETIENDLTELLLTHTTSLGVRKYTVEKTLLKREYQKLQTKYGPVTLKTAIYKGKKLKSKPEYEDCVRLAKEHNIPVNVIYQEINRLIANLYPDGD